MNKENSSAYFLNARRVIPGGVNSPVRAWKSVGKSRFYPQGKRQ